MRRTGSKVHLVIGALGSLLACGAFASNLRIINGTKVTPGTHKEVVQIVASGFSCTATVVGPRTLLTAAHCANSGDTAVFSVDGVSYKAKITRSSIYPTKLHDIAIGVTSQDIKGVTPAVIGGKATAGLPLTLYGMGCDQKNGSADGVLRAGETIITGFSDLFITSKKAGGGAICFGDNGGPAIVSDGGKDYLLGVHRTGNLVDTNYDVRTDIADSQNFLKDQASSQGLTICGINSACGGIVVTPAKPTCTLSASPSTIELGADVTLSLVTQGEVTEAAIGSESVSFPTSTKTVTPSAVGVFTAKASVKGPGGTNTCETTYAVKNTVVTPDKPVCDLQARPDTVKVGESVTLELSTKGQVTEASIEGTKVSFPLGKKIITAAKTGSFTVSGSVTGPGGTNQCSGTYQVSETIDPQPGAPDFTVVPAYCGDNTMPETKVSSVCLAVLKRSSSARGLNITQVVVVTYSDLTQEVLPIVYRKPQSKLAGTLNDKEDITFYANNAVPGPSYLVLDTRKGVFTKKSDGTPVALEGRTAKGNYFSVEKFTAQ